MPRDDAPAWLQASDCCGWTSDFLDAQLCETLSSAGKWRGRGFATVISDTRNGRPASPREKVCTALHELAHHLEVLARGSTVVKRTVQELAPFLDPPSKPVDKAMIDRVIGPRPAWHKHGVAFTRACGHVAHRASLAGFPAALSDLGAAGRPYRLSEPQAYLFALGDEQRACESEPLLDVLRRPAPSRFVELFERDIAKVAA